MGKIKSVYMNIGEAAENIIQDKLLPSGRLKPETEYGADCNLIILSRRYRVGIKHDEIFQLDFEKLFALEEIQRADPADTAFIDGIIEREVLKLKEAIEKEDYSSLTGFIRQITSEEYLNLTGRGDDESCFN